MAANGEPPTSTLTSAPSGSLTFTFVDEEELLGFKIWVAELELLVGGARRGARPDPCHCLQLLQKMVVALERSERPEVKEYQRRCEEAVVDILLKGAPPPVGGRGVDVGCCLPPAEEESCGPPVPILIRFLPSAACLVACPVPQVRRLICQVLAQLYARGDQLPLYSRVSSLQLFLGTREALRCLPPPPSCWWHPSFGVPCSL